MSDRVEIIVTATDEASKTLREIGSVAGGLGNVLGGALKIGLAGAAVGLGALGAGVAASVREAMNAESAMAQLDAVLKSTGQAAANTATEIPHATKEAAAAMKRVEQISKEAILALSDSLSQLTPFEDDAITGAQSMLLTFTNIGKDVFPAATETVLDMSQALGQDLKSSSVMLGKALNDPIQGVSALQRVGVSFTDAQKEQIKTLVESGRTMDAQNLILKELQIEFGGSAKAAGETFAGQMTILQNSFGNLMEQIGGAFLPVLKDLTSWVNQNVMPVFKQWAEAAIPALSEAFSHIIDLLSGNAFEDTIANIRENLEIAFGKDAADMITGIVVAFSGLVDWVRASAIPAFQEFSGWFRENVLPILVQLGQWITANLIPAIQQMASWFQSSSGQVSSAIGDLWTQIYPVLQQIFDTLSAFWTEIQPKIEAAWSAISIKLNEVWAAIQPVVMAIAEFLIAHSAEIKAMFEDVWNIITGIVSTAWSVISGTIKIALDLISGDFEGAFSDYQSMVNSVTAALEQIFQASWDIIRNLVGVALQAIWQVIDAKMNEIAGTISNIWNNVTAFFLNLPGTMVEHGQNIIQGLIDGLLNSANDVTDALRGIVDDAIGEIRRRLGIHSPSDVFAEIGAQMAAGLNEGFGIPQLNMAGAIVSDSQNNTPNIGALATAHQVMEFHFHIEHANFSSPQAMETEAKNFSFLMRARQSGMMAG